MMELMSGAGALASSRGRYWSDRPLCDRAAPPLLLLTPCTVLLRNYSIPPAGVGVADEGCGRGRLASRLGADCNAPVYSCVSRRRSLVCVRVVDCSKLRYHGAAADCLQVFCNVMSGAV